MGVLADGSSRSPNCHFTAALSRRASWGFFDPGEAAGGGQFFGDYRRRPTNARLRGVPIDQSIGGFWNPWRAC